MRRCRLDKVEYGVGFDYCCIKRQLAGTISEGGGCMWGSEDQFIWERKRKNETRDPTFVFTHSSTRSRDFYFWPDIEKTTCDPVAFFPPARPVSG
jgi:hypothetical protein